MFKFCHAAILLVMGAGLALAQQVLLLNTGMQIQGRYDGGDAHTVRFIDRHGDRHRFDISEIQSLVFSGPLPSATPTAYNGYDPNSTAPQFAERGYADPDGEPRSGWNRMGTIPPGADILVRTIDRIDVRHAEPRRHYLASIERDIRDSNGHVVIPRGSSAHLIVHDVGHGDIAIDLRSVRVNGRRYILNSENITEAHPREGLGANKRTGKFVGGSALVGTIIGAIAGGGKGAAIGALAGGAAGASAQVLTRGRALHIPPETVLSFRLDHPVHLYQ
jgi:hypothetical protein